MRAAIALAAALLVAACGPITGGPGQTSKIAVGTVLATPKLVDTKGTVVAPPVVTADVFYGERQAGVLPTTPPTGIPGARVKEHIFDDVANTVVDVTLDDQQDGHYTADSGTSPTLGPYDPQAEYRTDIEDDLPTAYVVDASQVPAPESPQGVQPTQPLQVDLTISRTSTDTAFISVYRLDGQSPKVTWTNLPASPLDLLSAIADPSAFQAASFTIPGSQAFPAAGQYAVVLTTVVRAVPGPNLDPASGVWVGAGAAVPLTVQ